MLNDEVSIPSKEEFLDMLPAIREVARQHGYAVGLHGSLARDFDLIACPWVKDAAHPDTLAMAIFEAAKCARWRVMPVEGEKPHGRRGYAFDWDKHNYENRGYIDLSVMPRLEEESG